MGEFLAGGLTALVFGFIIYKSIQMLKSKKKSSGKSGGGGGGSPQENDPNEVISEPNKNFKS